MSINSNSYKDMNSVNKWVRGKIEEERLQAALRLRPIPELPLELEKLFTQESLEEVKRINVEKAEIWEKLRSAKR